MGRLKTGCGRFIDNFASRGRATPTVCEKQLTPVRIGVIPPHDVRRRNVRPALRVVRRARQAIPPVSRNPRLHGLALKNVRHLSGPLVTDAGLMSAPLKEQEPRSASYLRRPVTRPHHRASRPNAVPISRTVSGLLIVIGVWWLADVGSDPTVQEPVRWPVPYPARPARRQGHPAGLACRLPQGACPRRRRDP